MFGNTVIFFQNHRFLNVVVYFIYDIIIVYNTSIFEYYNIQYIKVFEKYFGWDQSARARPSVDALEKLWFYKAANKCSFNNTTL